MISCSIGSSSTSSNSVNPDFYIQNSPLATVVPSPIPHKSTNVTPVSLPSTICGVPPIMQLDCQSCTRSICNGKKKGKDFDEGDNDWKRSINQVVARMGLKVVDGNGEVVNISEYMNKKEEAHPKIKKVEKCKRELKFLVWI